MSLWPTIWGRGLCIALFAWLATAHSASLPPRASAARGAIVFMNYCSGCHSLKYLPWSRIVNDLDLTQQSSARISSSLTLTLPNLSHTWPQVAMAESDATKWFGKLPPDLSLTQRQRGSPWIQAYLSGFYPDPQQSYGVNNHKFPKTRMPNVLESLQTTLPAANFAAVVADIACFLEYGSEPAVLERRRLGGYVVGFFILLAGLYWLHMRQDRQKF